VKNKKTSVKKKEENVCFSNADDIGFILIMYA
jgi:hypothetical protein